MNKSLKEEINDAIFENKRGIHNLQDFPFWMKTIGLGYANASRGIRLFRKIKSVSEEFNTSETNKFKQFVDNVSAPIAGFMAGLGEGLGDNVKYELAKISGELATEALQAGNRRAIINRNMRRNQVSIADIKRISDPEVRHIRSALSSGMRDAFENQLDKPEEQLLELAMSLATFEEVPIN